MVTIREADIEDVERIVDLTLDFENYLIDIDDTLMSEPFERGVYRKTLMEGLGDEKHRFFVAVKGGIIVAFADYWAYPEFLHGGVAGYMNNLYVSEESRGQGIGSALVDHILADARNMEAVAMHVPVKPLNKKAIEFYIKKGIDEQLSMMETRLDKD